MSEPITALSVVVTAENLTDGKEAYNVDLDAHPNVTNEWAVGMLRRIADSLEAGEGSFT